MNPNNFGFEGLKVYQVAFEAAMDIFYISKSFPKEEIYSLTSQIRRSSRAVCECIAEAYRKKKYPKHFVSKLTDSDAECSETIVWLSFAYRSSYINQSIFEEKYQTYSEIGRMLGSMINHPERFCNK
jgi:four helix bundle protein